MAAYLDLPSLRLMYSYLSNAKQIQDQWYIQFLAKNTVRSTAKLYPWSLVCNIFIVSNVNITNYADGNRSYLA